MARFVADKLSASTVTSFPFHFHSPFCLPRLYLKPGAQKSFLYFAFALWGRHMDVPAPTTGIGLTMPSSFADNNPPSEGPLLVIPFVVFMSGFLLFSILLALRLRQTRRRRQPDVSDDQNTISSHSLPAPPVSDYTVTERRKLGHHMSIADRPIMFEATVLRALEKGENKALPCRWNVLQPVNMEQPPPLQASISQRKQIPQSNLSENVSLSFIIRMPTFNGREPSLACQHEVMLGTAITTTPFTRSQTGLKASR